MTTDPNAQDKADRERQLLISPFPTSAFDYLSPSSVVFRELGPTTLTDALTDPRKRTTDTDPRAPITIADLAAELEVRPSELAQRVTALTRELGDPNQVIHSARTMRTTLIHASAADILREQATTQE